MAPQRKRVADKEDPDEPVQSHIEKSSNILSSSSSSDLAAKETALTVAKLALATEEIDILKQKNKQLDNQLREFEAEQSAESHEINSLKERNKLLENQLRDLKAVQSTQRVLCELQTDNELGHQTRDLEVTALPRLRARRETRSDQNEKQSLKYELDELKNQKAVWDRERQKLKARCEQESKNHAMVLTRLNKLISSSAKSEPLFVKQIAQLEHEKSDWLQPQPALCNKRLESSNNEISLEQTRSGLDQPAGTISTNNCIRLGSDQYEIKQTQNPAERRTSEPDEHFIELEANGSLPPNATHPSSWLQLMDDDSEQDDTALDPSSSTSSKLWPPAHTWISLPLLLNTDRQTSSQQTPEFDETFEITDDEVDDNGSSTGPNEDLSNVHRTYLSDQRTQVQLLHMRSHN